jgi:hypothetical protein
LSHEPQQEQYFPLFLDFIQVGFSTSVIDNGCEKEMAYDQLAHPS